MNDTTRSISPQDEGVIGMSEDQRATIRFERLLPHTVDRVWQSITEPEHMQTWLAFRARIDLRVGAASISGSARATKKRRCRGARSLCSTCQPASMWTAPMAHRSIGWPSIPIATNTATSSPWPRSIGTIADALDPQGQQHRLADSGRVARR
ncbi:MAG: hypothetical protein HRT86_08585 [Ilumatobacteraceae bacterium]|nr:hypothetical protein [Ilumatobacteraceae bacterium]